MFLFQSPAPTRGPSIQFTWEQPHPHYDRSRFRASIGNLTSQRVSSALEELIDKYNLYLNNRSAKNAEGPSLNPEQLKQKFKTAVNAQLIIAIRSAANARENILAALNLFESCLKPEAQELKDIIGDFKRSALNDNNPHLALLRKEMAEFHDTSTIGTIYQNLSRHLVAMRVTQGLLLGDAEIVTKLEESMKADIKELHKNAKANSKEAEHLKKTIQEKERAIDSHKGLYIKLDEAFVQLKNANTTHDEKNIKAAQDKINDLQYKIRCNLEERKNLARMQLAAYEAYKKIGGDPTHERILSLVPCSVFALAEGPALQKKDEEKKAQQEAKAEPIIELADFLTDSSSPGLTRAR